MTERIGRYRILRPLGEGGMGRVFLAESTAAGGFQRRVVLKQVRDTGDDDLRRALLDEARIQATLVHRNIVPVLDLEEHDGEHFVVLEHVDGLDLRRLISVCGPLPWPLVIHIGMEIAAGLDYVHRRTDAEGKGLELVHRDVTPANILCAWEGEVRLTDFGIAQVGARRGGVAGNFAYVAPEQAAAGAVDARADIYSLAVVLYEALTGTNPFRRDTDEATREAVRDGVAPPVSDLLAPIEVRTLITSAMALDPALRPSTAARFREALLAAPRRLPDPVPAFARFLADARPRVAGDRSGMFRLIEMGRAFTRRLVGGAGAADTIADARPPSRARQAIAVGLALVVAGAASWALWRRTRTQAPGPALTPVRAPVATDPPTPAAAPADPTPLPRPAEVAPPAPPASRPTRRGTLSVNAIPWGDVWLDDRAMGHTPRLGMSLPIGRHRVRVRTRGGDERSRLVEIRAGKETKLTVVFSDP